MISAAGCCIAAPVCSEERELHRWEDRLENSQAKPLPESCNDQHMNWYVRRGSAVQGPYASRQIARYLLLGRIRQTDRVSVDGELWQGLSEIPHLIPDEMKDLESEEGRARFLAAHLRADERGGEKAMSEAEVEMPGWRGHKERRHGSVVDEFDYVRQLAARYVDLRKRSGDLHPVLISGAAVIVLVTAGLLFTVLYDSGRSSLTGSQCGVQPRAHVNWAYCVKDKLSLHKADLRGAILRYVSMREADLSSAQLGRADMSYSKFSNANLSQADLRAASMVGAALDNATLVRSDLAGADLSQANLSGADLRGSDLQGAILDGAVWTNGRICRDGSVGHCLQ